MIRTRLTRMSVIAMLIALALVPTQMPSAAAQDATQEPGSESELAPQLPPVDLPTMNTMSYTFELESTWNGSGGSTPEELPVYEFTAIDYTEEEVLDIAERLGVEGEISSQGEGTFTIVGNGSIFTTPGLLQFVSAVEAPDEDLPNDSESIAFAREWLRISGLLPANSNDGEIVTEIDTPARKIVGFKPASPSPILASSPGITVTIGPGGTILEARVTWASIEQEDTYRLRGVEDAFTEIETRQSYLDVELPEDEYPQGSDITGTVAYDNVSVAWSTSGVSGEGQYLQPVYVFTGSLTPEGSDESYPITAYVPAIVSSLQPVG